ncbi:denticleless protein-like protein [Cucumis melo var. makuwa]|uniref:Denticleless protein-like protein n=1 Tax=Cucumis melo var. makuwa TaxID=1194695 RepID=A0A5A7UQ75_CUCMM|nr:denticleless protein-like protein [Cucumis melo var. makuwa]
MQTSRSPSFFQDLSSRELNGFRVRKRPRFSADIALSFKEVGAMSVEHDGDQTPPLAVSFCKTLNNSHIFALSDEDGYVSLFNTRSRFSLFSSHEENTEKSRVSEWEAHRNAVFDVCWIKDDTQMITASGDQSMKLWDVQEMECIGILRGHKGSVKSISSHPTNHDLIVSGSRDGSFALWDLRTPSCSKVGSEELCLRATAVVKGAHLSPYAKRIRRQKSASKSITSVLYLKDELSVATAGAVDSIVKFWDTRNLKNAITICQPKSSEKDTRLHGISSLSQDANGAFLSASCMDNSGSTDGNAHVWQVDKPHEDPITLTKHNGEVSAVDWSSFEVGKFVTSSDDFTVRVWNSQNNSCSSSKRPTSCNRKRIMAMPSIEHAKDSDSSDSPFFDRARAAAPSNSKSSMDMEHKLSTPESKVKRSISDATADLIESFEKTPEANSKSPSSVLNPPSSLKRKTIRDYFLVAP